MLALITSLQICTHLRHWFEIKFGSVNIDWIKYLACRFIPWEHGFLFWDDDFLLGCQVLERKNESPVEVSLARQRSIVDVRSLSINRVLKPTGKTMIEVSGGTFRMWKKIIDIVCSKKRFDFLTGDNSLHPYQFHFTNWKGKFFKP